MKLHKTNCQFLTPLARHLNSIGTRDVTLGQRECNKKKKSFGRWDLSLLWTRNHLLQLQLSLSWKQPNQLVSKSCRLWLCQQKNWVMRIICFKLRFQRGAQQCQSRESRSARTSERIARMHCVNWLHQCTNLCTGDSTLYRKGRS